MRWPTTWASSCGRCRCPRRQPWSLTSLREKLIKIGAKVVRHGRYAIFQLAEVAVRAADVPGNPVADRPAAGSTRPSMTGSGVEWCGRRKRSGSHTT